MEQVRIMQVAPEQRAKDLMADQVLPAVGRVVVAEQVAEVDQLPVPQAAEAVPDYNWQYPEYHNGMPQEQADIPMALVELAAALTMLDFVIELIPVTVVVAIKPTQ